MFKIGQSLILALLCLLLYSGIAMAQSITQETYDRLEMPAIKGLIYGAIDAAAAFSELGEDITLLADSQWQNRWYNAGFLIGWHGDTLAQMDSTGNTVLDGIKQAAQSLMDGYDAVDLGIKLENDMYIQSGIKSILEGMEYILAVYAIIDPTGVEEIKVYQEQRFGNTATESEVAVVESTATPTPVSTTKPISQTTGVINRSANLRGGPGTNYPIVGGAKAGDNVEIIGQNTDGTWLKLAGDKWIAAFLVNQGQSALPAVVVTPVQTQPAATATPSAPTPTATPVVEEKIAYWGDAGVQTCGNFEWRISNVRRAKDTWYYNRNQVAQGEYLLIYVEVKNISGGTASFWGAQPTMPGKEIAERASQYGAWMMTGGFNTLWKDDIAPGEFLTLVGAFDVAPDTHTYLFGAIACKQLVAIGSWFELARGAVKAGN
jgi:hypothetical protein